MLVAIDAGNTKAKIALFNEKGLIIQKEIIPTKPVSFFSSSLKNFIKKINCSNSVVSSVVTEVNESINKIFNNTQNITPLFITTQNINNLTFKYDKPEMLGSDRIANILAALSIYKPPVLVCDFGTATTFSLALKKNEFSGGLIAPGINTSFVSLTKSTSKLPEVEINGYTPLIGNSTYECIRSGVYFMQQGFIEKIIKSIKIDYPDVKTICTGGYAKYFAENFDLYNENLVLTGCYEFFKNFIKK